jgi:hypothetical protein
METFPRTETIQEILENPDLDFMINQLHQMLRHQILAEIPEEDTEEEV